MDKINLDEIGITLTIMDERTSQTYEFHIIDYDEVVELIRGDEANDWFFNKRKIEDIIKEKQRGIEFFLPMEDIKWVSLEGAFDQINFSKLFTSSVNENKFTIIVENQTDFGDISVVNLMLKHLS